MRLIVSGASSVCSVDSTRWPVSAARSAVSIVSMSRISPIEDDVGVLTQRALETVRVGRRVEPDFALRDDGLGVLVDEFDRVLNREDVQRRACG